MERNQKVKRCASIKEYIRDIIIDSVVDEESRSGKVVAFICHVFWMLLAFFCYVEIGRYYAWPRAAEWYEALHHLFSAMPL